MSAAQYTAVPEEMKQLSRWITWDGVSLKDKKPYISGTFKQASTTTPEHLVCFDQAIENIQNERGYSHLGFVPQQPIVGLDLDSCRNPLTGEIQPWAIEFLTRVGPTYTEITPSQGGLRAWVNLALDKKKIGTENRVRFDLSSRATVAFAVGNRKNPTFRMRLEVTEATVPAARAR